MTIYYVSNTHASRSDGNAGTSQSAPWATFKPWNDEMNAGNINGGDSLYIDGSGSSYLADASNTTTKEQTTLRMRGSAGSSFTSMIEITSYNGTAVLDANAEATSLLWYTNAASTPADYVYVHNLRFTGCEDRVAISIKNSTGWIVEDCEVDTSTTDYGGISCDNSITCIFRDNNCHDLAGEGFHLAKSGSTTPTTWDSGHLIYNNTIADCEGEGIDLKADSENCIIYNNTVSDCGQYGTSQIHIGGINHRVINNRVTGVTASVTAGIDCSYWNNIPGGRQGAEDIWIEGNLLDDCDGTNGAIYLRGKNIKCINNTIANNTIGINLDSESDTTIGNSHTQHLIYNNAFYNNTNDIYASTSTASLYDIDYNWYDSGTSGVWYWSGSNRDFTYVQGTLGFETNGNTGSQGFVDTTDFELDVGSSLRDAGDVAYSHRVYRNTAPDIGWHEYETGNYTIPNLEIRKSEHDGRENAAGSPNITLTSAKFDDVDHWGMFIFEQELFNGLPQGATIENGTYFELYCPNGSFLDMDVTIYAEDSISVADITTSTDDISNRTVTTASVAWSEIPLPGTGYNDSPELKTVIQEIADLGRSTDTDIGIILDVGASSEVTVSYWDKSEWIESARLHIVYSLTVSTGVLNLINNKPINSLVNGGLVR